MPGFEFYEVKEKYFSIIFQKENGNTFTLLIIFIVKVFKKSKITQIYYYDPQSAGINVQSPQSESTLRRLTLTFGPAQTWNFKKFKVYETQLYIY